MKIFAIDTSAVAASCALAEDGKIIFEFYTNAGLQHSRTLAPMIESAFKCTEISISDVDCFAVSKGPGSFTDVSYTHLDVYKRQEKGRSGVCGRHYAPFGRGAYPESFRAAQNKSLS